ncbi:MAG: energy transducer TonB [Sedimenticola sp.]|nr:energy transducer TonB [Sedimenticola sp.]
MSIRIASILISVLAHGTAYLYLGDFISLDRPSLAERGQGMKLTLVRAEKAVSKESQQSMTKLDPVAIATEATPSPTEERPVASEPVALSDDVKVAPDLVIEQINRLPPTAAGKPVRVASKVPKTVKKRLPDTPPVETKPDVEPVIAKPQQPGVQVALASSAEPPAAPVEGVHKEIPSDQDDRLLAIEMAYADALAAAIEKHKRYPLRARKKGQEGEVKVLFTVLEDGTIAQVQIAESSMSSLLDRAASKAVEQLGRFEPIPQQLGRKRWDFQVPVRFAMN